MRENGLGDGRFMISQFTVPKLLSLKKYVFEIDYRPLHVIAEGVIPVDY
jgi:hypothetical protein